MAKYPGNVFEVKIAQPTSSECPLINADHASATVSPTLAHCRRSLLTGSNAVVPGSVTNPSASPSESAPAPIHKGRPMQKNRLLPPAGAVWPQPPADNSCPTISSIPQPRPTCRQSIANFPILPYGKSETSVTAHWKAQNQATARLPGGRLQPRLSKNHPLPRIKRVGKAT